MALKAGYNGVKKSVLDKLLQMSGALIIKSLGTALSLSDAGELRVRNASDSHSGVVQPDGETTSIVEGKLVSKGGVSYSTLEQDTGLKWVDGKKIYQKTYALAKSEFADVQSSSSLWSGYLYTDLDDYDSIWLDIGNSFILRNGPVTSTTYQLSLCLEQGDTGGIRTTIFDGDENRNAGKPYVFLKVQYAHGIIYPNEQNPKFYITVRYTKVSENISVN